MVFWGSPYASLEECIGFLTIKWRDLSIEGKQVAEGLDRDGGSGLGVRDGETVLLSRDVGGLAAASVALGGLF